MLEYVVVISHSKVKSTIFRDNKKEMYLKVTNVIFIAQV